MDLKDLKEEYPEIDKLFNETEDFLKENSLEILEEMENEGYELRYKYYNFIEKIEYNGKLVGFASFLARDASFVVLSDAYVLKEYRGNFLLYKTIGKLFKSGIDIALMLPTRAMIQVLLKSALAMKVTPDLILSAVPLAVDGENLLANKGETPENTIYVSNYYNSTIGATIFPLDLEDKIYYSRLLKEDGEEIKENREKIDEHYFERELQFFRDEETHAVIDMFKKRLEQNIPKPDYTIEKLLGPKDGEMGMLLKGLTEKEAVSLEDGEKIKKQLYNELEKGIVEEKHLFLRLIYLCAELRIDKKEIDITENVCPYCGEKINVLEDTCKTCGYNLNYHSD